jgi:hypothetical protein
MKLNFGNSCYSFGFKPSREFEFQSFDFGKNRTDVLPCLKDQLIGLACQRSLCFVSPSIERVVEGFPKLFFEKLGTVKGMVCEIDLTDNVPVRSRPYQCSPPKLKILREVVQDLLEKGVVRKSNSQYASPTFLVPKPNGGHRMVIDYRLLNKKVVFDAFPMPTVENAFDHFGGAKIFSVLDLNSAYYQILLSAKSKKVTAICTPFGLFEFNKLPMGISVGCQVLSRVVDSLFGDIEQKYVYNFMDDLVVYSANIEEHAEHLKEVFRLEKAGFTLNKSKVHLAQHEITFFGHSLSGKGLEVLPERVEAIQQFPTPKNLKAVRRFLGMVGFYARFVLDFSKIAENLHALKRKNVKFEWGESQQRVFDQLKAAFSTPPVL